MYIYLSFVTHMGNLNRYGNDVHVSVKNIKTLLKLLMMRLYRVNTLDGKVGG